MTTATITPSAAAGSLARITEFAATVALRVVNLVRAYKNRRDMQALASLDDRMLADIGLTRGDVRDAFAEPVWHDPSRVLVTRSRERRYSRRSAVQAVRFVTAPPTAPGAETERELISQVRARYY